MTSVQLATKLSLITKRRVSYGYKKEGIFFCATKEGMHIAISTRM